MYSSIALTLRSSISVCTHKSSQSLPLESIAQQPLQVTALLAIARDSGEPATLPLEGLHDRHHRVVVRLRRPAESEFVPLYFRRRGVDLVPDELPAAHGDSVGVHEGWNGGSGET